MYIEHDLNTEFEVANHESFASGVGTVKVNCLIAIKSDDQGSDPVAPREAGIALFNAFGSREKAMHINPGGHLEIPNYEASSWEAFYRRHLGVGD